MKTVNTDKQVSAVMNAHGAFFAFSKSQMSESAKEGVEYVRLDCGMLAPKATATKLVEELTTIYEAAHKFIVDNNHIDDIIEYHLANHESWYTGDLDDAMDSLEAFNVTHDQVLAVYRARSHKHED